MKQSIAGPGSTGPGLQRILDAPSVDDFPNHTYQSALLLITARDFLTGAQ